MYIVDLLVRLTGVGLLRWTGDKMNGFFTMIGGFTLKVFKSEQLVKKWKLFGQEKNEMELQWILQIKDSDRHYEELSGSGDSEINTLWHIAGTSSRRKGDSPIQGELLLEILRKYNLRP